MKASEELLDKLHGLVCKELINRLKTGEATPAELSTAIRFLKDNEVVADINTNPKLNAVKEALETPIGDLPFDVPEEA